MTSSRKKHEPRLSDRDRQIIDHTARYRLTTNEVLHQLFFESQQPNAVIKVTSRLRNDDWLRRFPLLYPRHYLIPGKRAVQALGLPLTRIYPLGPQSLPRQYAVLCYCATTPDLRRLIPHELTKLIPWYKTQWLDMPHCFRATGEEFCIEIMRIDLGGPADHVARKCLADIEFRCSATEFSEALKSGRMRLVIITASTDKAAATQLALEGHLWPDGLTFHLAVVPELLPLLPRCSDAT